MFTFFLIGIGITIGIGVVQYILGKNNLSRNKGMLIPIIYFLSRMFLVISTGGKNLGFSILSAGSIAYIYYHVFIAAKKKIEISQSED